MKGKRSLERFDLHIPALLKFMSSDQEKSPLNLLTSNVFSGGAFFHNPQPLPEDTQVKPDLLLTFDKLKKLKDEHKVACIKVTGTVLRSEPEGMAICFDEDYQIIGSA